MEEESTKKPQVLNDDPSREKHGYSALLWLQWIPVLFLAYILSIGPVAKICRLCNMPGKYPRTEAVIEAVYAPITALMQNSPPAARVLLWYIEKVWRVDVRD